MPYRPAENFLSSVFNIVQNKQHIMMHTDYDTFSGRRQFLSSVKGLVGTSILMTLPGLSRAGGLLETFTVKQVIDIILKEIPNAPFPKTVDQLRSGSMEQEVTGIVTTMFPTIEVIERTAKAGANFIIAHETPFYNNQDETDWLQQDDAYRYKIGLLDKYKIAIWRFHDYWHSHKPDGIIMGNLIKLGWEKYFDANTPRLLTLPTAYVVEIHCVACQGKVGYSKCQGYWQLKTRMQDHLHGLWLHG